MEVNVRLQFIENRMQCSICKKEDQFSELEGKCIFHCDKLNWFEIRNGAKHWDGEKVGQFWKEVQKNHKNYFFYKFVFPQFYPESLRSFTPENGEIIFAEARFLAEADFGLKPWPNEINKKVVFHNRVIFEKAVFCEEADFSSAKFMKEVSFTGTKFEKTVSFDGAKFHERINLDQAKFLGDLIFSRVEVKSLNTFISFEVQGKSDFSFSTFEAPIFFLETRFQKEMIFSNTKFEDSCFFKGVHFPRNSYFQKVDLTKVIFSSEAEVDSLSFFECKFKEAKGRKILLNEKIIPRKGYHEYLTGFPYEKETSYEEVENLYRKLKKNFEEKKDWETSGDFYIGELEMLRRRWELNAKTKGFLALMTNNITRRSLLFWYNVLSVYGERPGRVLGSILLSLIFFTGLFWYSFDFAWELLPKSFGMTIENFIPFLPKLDLETATTLQRVIYDFEIFLSGILWFLLILSINRKFKR